VSARLLEEAGCVVVAVSEDYGGIYNPLGLPMKKLLEYRAREGTLKGFLGAQLVSNEDLLKIECDVLVPAALENQITSQNAGHLRCRLIVEGANGPTTPEADEILRKRGIVLVPDILANAGGVTVSYFEWVQDLQSFFWSEHEINARLESIMKRAFNEVLAIHTDKGVDLRLAAYLLAVRRVADATADRGIYP
jgi:glutamate dehydrogenase/leucine dehydrogenase